MLLATAQRLYFMIHFQHGDFNIFIIVNKIPFYPVSKCQVSEPDFRDEKYIYVATRQIRNEPGYLPNNTEYSGIIQKCFEIIQRPL